MSDRPSPDLLRLTRYLAGHFNNFEQATDQPINFANIHVHHCPLPWSVFDGPGLYLEQYYDIYPNHPYRQGAYKLYETEEGLWIQNYALSGTERFVGACRDRDRLQELATKDFAKLNGCLSKLVPTETGFHGESVPSKDCIVERNGHTTYLSVTFDITNHNFRSHDRGMDVETDEQIWGALLGPFEFSKLEDYSSEVPVPSGVKQPVADIQG